MEKYTTWRDPSTGIAPFLPPVPAAETLSPILLLPKVLGVVFAIPRTLLVILIFLLRFLLSPLESLPLVLPVLDRLTLLLLGYSWINVDTFSQRLSRASLPKKDASIRGGDIIVSNWTSYIDVLYLSFRYKAQFLLPHVSTSSGAAQISFSLVSPLRMILRTGLIPAVAPTAEGESLGEIEKKLQKSGRVGVLFPECTTSNNRGLLKWASFIPTPPTTTALPGTPSTSTRTRYHLIVFKHPPPSPLLSSVTQPVPTTLNPLLHLFRVCSSPLPRSLLVKVSATPLEASLVGKDEMRMAETKMSEMAKLKRCVGMGWEEKKAFLELYLGGKVKGRKKNAD
ncbi:hypothetical protein BT69DRAFT_1352963 [Atractiella rhizophila]|nr:hypothetical protein BT69DRAFT_1352963 [Atractiella rhizophila]